MPTDIGVIYKQNPESRIHRFIERNRLEKIFASLPPSVRHKLALRRSPDFSKAIRNSTFENEDYNFTCADAMNCIFIHIPKTAGISLAKSLFGNYGGGHLPVYYYLWFYGARQFDSMFKFSFVRHPETRLVSAFNYLYAGGGGSIDADWSRRWLHGCHTVDDFVQNVLPIPEVKTALHFRKQSFYITDPRTGKIGVDFLGRQENFQRDFESLCGSLDIHRTSMKTNVSSPVGKSNCLSPASQKLVQEIYADDFDMLDY